MILRRRQWLSYIFTHGSRYVVKIYEFIYTLYIHVETYVCKISIYLINQKAIQRRKVERKKSIKMKDIGSDNLKRDKINTR